MTERITYADAEFYQKGTHMKKRFLAVLLVGLMALSISACKSSDVFETTIFEKLESDAENSGDADEETQRKETKSGATLPDGTLKDSRLTEQEKPFAGLWESEDGHILAIREAAITEDGAETFPLDAIAFFPYVKKAKEYENTWDLVTRGNENLSLTEIDGKIFLRDSQYCPASDDPNDTSTHETTNQLEYDISTDTITYSMLVAGDAGYWEGAEGMINHVVFQRTDKDIDEADWDWYYDGYGWKFGRDPRQEQKTNHIAREKEKKWGSHIKKEKYQQQ